MGNSYSNFAEQRLKKLSKTGEVEIGFTPNIEVKADKPEANKPPKQYSNPYEEYIKTWEPGDVIPLVPPGKRMHFCTFNPNMLDTDSTFFRSTHNHLSTTKFKSGAPEEIEYKVLGRKLKDSLESLLRRAANARGLWVDDKNKLRCPPGTPAANQFTDITGSNCFIPTPRTAAQTGARAIRRATTSAAQMAAPTGGRVATGFDVARANAEQIREMGFERVQEMMAYGGRIVPTPAMVGDTISGAMRSTRFGLIPDPSAQVGGQKRKAPKGGPNNRVWQLGLKEQVWRGRRATELARSTRDRFNEPNRPDGLRLPPSQSFPNGRPIGDISQKAQFVSAMQELFPNVPVDEIEEMFDQAIPQSLSRMDRFKLKQALIQYWYSWMAEAIANPEQAKWITSFEINPAMNSAFEVRFDAFAPSPSAGGRRISQAASNLAQAGGRSAEQGGLQFSIHMNPWQMWTQVNRAGGFDRNGRANGVADSVEGDMHYLATHEWGHVAHFSTVMETLGFQTQNLQRYGNAQKLVKPQQGKPQWQRERQVNAWIIDFRQAANPTGNRSIQLLIDSAQRLSTRQYVRSGNWGNVTGYTRQDLETDLDNFHNALAEAIQNNITDDFADQELMRAFAGGVYAASDNIEARAEFYAARRLFGDPALTGGQTGIPSTVDEFAQTMAAAQGAIQTAAQYRAQMDDIGQQTFGVPGNSWNISGRMAGSGLQPQRPTLKTQAVRRAVDQNYSRRNRNDGFSGISGAMRSGGVQPRTVSGSDWKNQDTISSPNTNMPLPPQRQAIPSMLQSALGAPQSSTPIVGRMSSGVVEAASGVRTRFDGSKAGNIDARVYDINGEKVVFDNPDAVSFEDSSIKVIPKNPFEISGKPNTSKEGREYSEKWLMAQLGRGDMKSDDVDALLYRASRGDADAERELDSLAQKGNASVSAEEDKLYKPVEFDTYQQREIRQAGLGDLSVDDLYVVHETSYEPAIDENGDISIAPRSNFEEESRSGKKVRVPRHTVHFALNHLVEGHVFRQRSDKDTTILIAPLSQVIKDNPDALDNLYVVDTIMTPKPGEGIKLKAGTFRRITGTPDKEATEEAVRQQLNEMGATKIFKAESAESSTEAQDLAVRKIASQLKTQSGLHSNIPSGMIENYLIRQAGSGQTADINLPPEWVAKMSRNHRQRVGDTNFWSDANFATTRGRMSGGPNLSAGGGRIKKNKDGVPQYPRTPTYGPMLGDVEQIFEGVTSWEDFKQKYDDQEIVFLDYETTGLVFDKFGRALENGNPVEIGAIKVKNGQVIDRFNVFVNPGKPLQQWSKDNLRDADGNPLTDEYLQGMESLESGHRKLIEFAGPNAIMGVQNAAYDKNVLEDTLRENGIDWQAKGWIDLKDMASMTLPRYSKENPDGPFRFDKEKQENVPSNGLADITKYLGVPLGKEHHRADKDAEATAESMRRLIDGAIEKNWSKDVFSRNKRQAYVKNTQDTFDTDVKEWESELAKYLGEGVSGKMASSSPALQKTPTFGRRQNREYYSSLPSGKSWRPETLEQSEASRIAKRTEIIKDIKQFLNNGEGDVKYASAMNGLDPDFADYIKNTDNVELMADLRQAAVEFHAGIDQRPRLNADTANIASIMETGLRRDDSNKPRRLAERMKAYEADIGIPPDTQDSDRPIIGYMVHADADFAEKEDAFKEFSGKVDANSERYKFDLFNPKKKNRNSGFNSVFGDAEIILKPETGERTAYGNGDALDNHIYPVLANSTDSDEIGRALIDPNGRFDERESNAIELLYGKFKNDFNAYRRDNGQTRPQINGAWGNRDALIMAGVQPNDIEEVRIPFKSLDTSNSTTAQTIAKKPRELKYLPVTEYVDETPRVAAPPAAPPNPPDDDPNKISKEELDELQEKMKRSYAATKDEQQIIEDILSGVRPMNAIPKDIAIRIDNVDRFGRIADDFANLQKVEEADRLQALARARGISLAITNDFGLDIFDGRSFSSNAPKSKTSKEVIEAKIDKQIEELIETMRQAKFNNIKNITDSRKRLEKMQETFDKLIDSNKNT